MGKSVALCGEKKNHMQEKKVCVFFFNLRNAKSGSALLWDIPTVFKLFLL